MELDDFKMGRVEDNHVVIAGGTVGVTDDTIKTNSGDLVIDTSYSGYNYLRRSGIVLNVPSKLNYYKPSNIIHKVDNVVIEKGDMVFFDPFAFQYCQDEHLVFTKSDNRVYIMPYHYIVCAVRGDNVVMVNGKVLVKMRPDLDEQYGIEVIRSKKFDCKYAEVVEVGNNEGYRGYYIGKHSQSYLHFDYNKRRELNRGDIILVNKFSEFDLQSIFKQVTDHNELDKTFVVDRSAIIGYKQKQSDKLEPYGFYFTVDAEERNREVVDGIVYAENKKLIKNKGVVTQSGCAVSNANIGSTVIVKEKSEVEIEGQIFVHNEWILLSK